MKNYTSGKCLGYFHKGLELNDGESDKGERLKVLNINKNFSDFKNSFIFLNDRLIYKPKNLVSSLSGRGVELLTTYNAVLKNT